MSETELEIGVKLITLSFASKRQVFSSDGIGETVFQTGAVHDLFNFRSAVTEGIQPADIGTNAGAGDVVNGDIVRFQYFNDGDVSTALGTAAG